MIRLIAPNGVAFNASDADASRLLACGYTEAKPKPQKEEKASKKQPKKDKE
ncbi:MAG: hypothetical protein IJ113_02375 [Eggerthellaceae bacterium]|nr:hypothetical protein [Eggerthellaceae bacterium]